MPLAFIEVDEGTRGIDWSTDGYGNGMFFGSSGSGGGGWDASADWNTDWGGGDAGVDIGFNWSGGGGGNGGGGSTVRRRTPAEIVDAAEPALKANLADYQAGRKSQRDALAYFDQVWANIAGQCGSACTTDRQAGACKWQQNGKCWNWFVGYRDPIANGVTATTPNGSPSAASAAGLSGNIGIFAIGAIVIASLLMEGRG